MVQYFRCQCAQVYHGEKFDKVTKQVLERDDYVQCNVQHNERYARPGGAGINGSKKTSTCRHFSSSDDCCPFNLSIFVDDHGYYIKLNTGNPTHEFHGVRENLQVPSKMLDGDSTTILKDVNSARATPGVAVSLHFQRSARLGRPTVLSHHQIQYIMTKANGKVNASDCLEVPHEGTMDELYNHLEKDGLQYISLLQKLDENNQGQLINETKHGRIMIDYSPISEDSETAKAIQLTNSERARRPLISNEQEMVVALAYSTPFEIRQFQAFHVVLHIDGTCHSNKERRPLILVTSKDNRGKMFTVLRAFLSSEQAWAFQWLFNTVFPQLLGKKTLSDVKLMVTDGDAQETSQLDYAIKRHFPQVYRQRCVWHVVDRSWKSKLKTSLPLGGKSDSKRPEHLLYTPRSEETLTISNKIARTIYRWLFSWGQAGYCETEEEYIMSKMLFLKYIQNPSIVSEIGLSNVERILQFLRETIFPVEEKTVYWKRHSIFHLNIHSNSAHEGMNSGIKHCAIPVKPQHSLAQAAKILTQNATIREENTVIQVCSEVHNRKLWSQSPTASHLTVFGESLVSQEFRESSQWNHHRISTHEWLVSYNCDEYNSRHMSGEDGIDFPLVYGPSNNKCGPIPRFKRIYKVSITSDDKRVMKCTCATQERMGYPCRHIGCVLSKADTDGVVICPNFKGFPVSSVSVFWWSILYRYGTSNKEVHQPLRTKLLRLVHKDTPGYMISQDPSTLPGHIREWPGMKHLYAQHPQMRLLNYTTLQASEAWQLYINGADPQFLDPPGLSQRSFVSDGLVENTHSSEDESSYNGGHYDSTPLQHDKDLQNVRAYLKNAFSEMCSAITDSADIKTFTEEAENIMNRIAQDARSRPWKEDPPIVFKGKRVSMFPATNRKRKHNASTF